MLNTKWSHLPNAHYIDRLLESAYKHPGRWTNAWWIAQSISGKTQRFAALNAAKKSAMKRTAAWNSAWEMLPLEVMDSVAALIAWDDCAPLLDSYTGELGILAQCGNPKAILLLSACIAFSLPD